MSFVKKSFRFVWKTLLVLLCVALAVVVFALAGGLGPTVKYVGPKVAKAFGVDMSVQKCVILPLGGYVLVEGLRVENPRDFAEKKPKVYAEEPLVKLGTLEVDVGVRSLLSKEIAVDTLRLEGVRALYAFDLDTTNVDALLAQMGVTGASSAEAVAEAEEEGKEAQEEAAKPAAEREPVEFRVGYLHVGDNVVTVRKFVSVPVPLPALTLRDVDSHTLRARVSAALAPLYKTIEGLNKGLGAATESLKDGGEALGSALGEGAAVVKDVLGDGANLTGEGLAKGVEGLKDVGEGLKEGLKGSGDEAKKALDDLKGLFKKKK